MMLHRRLLRRAWSIALAAWLLVVAVPAWCGVAEMIPNPRETGQSWVSDTAEVLSHQAETRINNAVDKLKQLNGGEVAVVTIRHVPQGQSAKGMATELFNSWGIGERGKDNGLLFLIAVESRRIEVETGYGTEAVLNDARVGRILDQQVIPHFRSGNIEAGIVAGSEAFVDAMSRAEVSHGFMDSDLLPGFWILALLPGSVAALLLSLLLRMKRLPLVLSPVGTTRTSSDPMLQKSFYVLSATAVAVTAVSLIIVAILAMQYSQMSPIVILTIFIGMVALGICLPFMQKRLTSYANNISVFRRLNLRVRCKVCKQQMEPVAPDVVLQSLTATQAAAQSYAGVHFEAWHCPHCHPVKTIPLMTSGNETAEHHLIADERDSPYCRCPKCGEKAVRQHIKYVSHSPMLLGVQGMRRITRKCLACGHEDQQDIVFGTVSIARSDDDFGGGSSGSSFGGGSSSSGGSFGGGSSGGGGSGRSW